MEDAYLFLSVGDVSFEDHHAVVQIRAGGAGPDVPVQVG